MSIHRWFRRTSTVMLIVVLASGGGRSLADEPKLSGAFSGFTVGTLIGAANPGYVPAAHILVKKTGAPDCVKADDAKTLTMLGGQYAVVLASRWPLEGDDCSFPPAMASGPSACEVLVFERVPQGARLVAKADGLSACSSVLPETLSMDARTPLLQVRTAWTNHGYETAEDILFAYDGTPKLKPVFTRSESFDGNAPDATDTGSTSYRMAPSESGPAHLVAVTDFGTTKTMKMALHTFSGGKYKQAAQVNLLAANRGWQATGYTADAGTVVAVDAEGEWNLAREAGWQCGPAGTTRATIFEHRVTKSAALGSLVCMVAGSPLHYAGMPMRFLADRGGEVLCRVNETDAWVDDNSGGFVVQVSRGK